MGHMSNEVRRAELDGVRGIAILLVLVGHTNDGLGPLAAAGVALFFTLSGYLITGILLSERERHGFLNLRRFYLRRATRLAPPLLAMLLVMAPLMGSSWTEVLGPATWTANYTRLLGVETGFGHTWSLGVEEQFYIVWPVLLLLLTRLRKPAAALLGLVGVLTVWRLLLTFNGHSDYAYMSLETAGVSILAGCLIALAGVHLRGREAIKALVLLVVVASAAVMLDGGLLVWHLTPVLTTPAAAALIAAARGATWLTWRPLVFCGVASYSVYLWHVPVSWLVGKEPAGVVIGAMAGLLAWAAVERPLMAWRAREHERLKPARADAPAPTAL